MTKRLDNSDIATKSSLDLAKEMLRFNDFKQKNRQLTERTKANLSRFWHLQEKRKLVYPDTSIEADAKKAVEISSQFK